MARTIGRRTVNQSTTMGAKRTRIFTDRDFNQFKIKKTSQGWDIDWKPRGKGPWLVMRRRLVTEGNALAQLPGTARLGKVTESRLTTKRV